MNKWARPWLWWLLKGTRFRQRTSSRNLFVNKWLITTFKTSIISLCMSVLRMKPWVTTPLQCLEKDKMSLVGQASSLTELHPFTRVQAAIYTTTSSTTLCPVTDLLSFQTCREWLPMVLSNWEGSDFIMKSKLLLSRCQGWISMIIPGEWLQLLMKDWVEASKQLQNSTSRYIVTTMNIRNNLRRITSQRARLKPS